MESTAPRPFVYPYLDRSFTLELAGFMLFAPILVSLWAIVLFYYYYSGYISPILLRSAGYFTGAFIFMKLFYGNTCAISRERAVIVDTDKVMKKSHRGTLFVRWADIAGISGGHRIPLLNRRITLATQDGGRFTLPLRVRNSAEMVDSLFDRLIEHGAAAENSDHFKNKLRGIAKHLNILYGLRERNLQNIFLAATAAALLNCAVSAVYWDRGVIFTLLHGVLGLFTQMAAYFAAEKAHLRKLMKGGGGDGWYLPAGLLALLLGMVAGILVTEPI